MGRVLPILFNTEMVRAIMREINPKTATRRAIKGFIPEDAVWGYTMFTPKGYISCRGTFADGYGEKFFRLPCKKGDILYVRETWCKGSLDYNKEQYYYRADNNKFCCRWHPSIHMPKEAARIWLKVTDVRVEKLHEIDDNGILAEGLEIGCYFDDLWNSTIKKKDLTRYGWDANPWVWVIEFSQCGRPE